MLILTIRTDKPEAELGLYQDDKQVAYVAWQAHRQLAETLHKKLQELFAANDKELSSLQGLVVFKGPGSFTGLRIGISVANALADSLTLSIVGAKGEQWIEQGTKDLKSEKSDGQVIPDYGAEPHITVQKK